MRLTAQLLLYIAPLARSVDTASMVRSIAPKYEIQHTVRIVVLKKSLTHVLDLDLPSDGTGPHDGGDGRATDAPGGGWVGRRALIRTNRVKLNLIWG